MDFPRLDELEAVDPEPARRYLDSSRSTTNAALACPASRAIAAIVTTAPSYRSKCDRRRHSRRPDSRQQARERADENGRGDAAQPRLDRDHDGPTLGTGVHGGGRCPGHHADHAADDGEQDRLTEELRPDLALRRTKSATEAHLRSALQNRHDHDVGDADEALRAVGGDLMRSLSDLRWPEPVDVPFARLELDYRPASS
jgi:hypothetical protein